MPIEDDIPEPPEEELEMAVEEATGKDTPGSPAERIEALKKRIAYLEQQLAALIHHADVNPVNQGAILDQADIGAISHVQKDLTNARSQLIYWRALHEGRN